MGSIVHALNSYLRYLQASDPLQTPPGIQNAITLLIDGHGRVALGCNQDEICVLVRPQWTYNLKYIDLIHQFEDDANYDLAFALDPSGTLGVYEPQKLIGALWEEAGGPVETHLKVPDGANNKFSGMMPKHVAVLSFAGLDRDDVLLYPLLAHELGHFLDFALDDIGKQSTFSKTSALLPNVADVVGAKLRIEDLDSVTERILVCLREITADLLAVRMVGLGYLFAFNEFFKTLSPYPGPPINHASGYPGFGLRLKLIFQELSSPEAGMESVRALDSVLSNWRHSGRKTINDYMAQLQKCTEVEDLKIKPGAKSAPALVENIVTRAIPAVQELVREIIPSASAAKVPQNVGEMIDLLEHRVPPFQPPTRLKRKACDFRPWSFHEILTAGWLYQFAIGEVRRSVHRAPNMALENIGARACCFRRPLSLRELK